MSDEAKDGAEKQRALARGGEIRRAREAKNMSQADLAVATGVSQQTIDRIERGAVLHSRSYPVLRQYLQLDILGYDTWPYEEGENPGYRKSSLTQSLREGAAVEKVFTGMIPVISNRGGTIHLADAIPKVFPFEFADGVTAFLVTDSEMEPVLKVGDIVVVNPHIPPRIGDEVAYARDSIAYIRTFVAEHDDHWLVKSWNPETETKVLKGQSLKDLDVIVAKYNRNR